MMTHLDRVEASRFLGRDFLLWLWFESERQEGLFEVPGFGTCEVWLEEQLTLEAPGQVTAQSALKGTAPSGTPEAKEALRQGKLPTKAKIRITQGPQSWLFAFAADAFSLSGVKLPAVLKEEDDERFYERMHLIEELEGMVGGLYETFVRARTSAAWEAEWLPRVRAWAAPS